MLRTLFLSIALITIILTPTLLLAHDGATGVVKERMDLMKTIGKNTKLIAPIAMGAADMNLKAVEESAATISQSAKQVIHKFPKDSIHGPSEAKENIWTNWEIFSGLMKNMVDISSQLEQQAKEGDEFEIMETFEKLAANCKKCHMDFRQKK